MSRISLVIAAKQGENPAELAGCNRRQTQWMQTWRPVMPEAKTVLYIEDNSDNRLLVRRLLTVDGYRLEEAENARQGLKILETARPDLILVDINMPDMDGYTLTRKIRELAGFSEVPIVAITANVMKGDREKTMQAGCDGYIDKPIDVDRFPDMIAHYLDHY